MTGGDGKSNTLWIVLGVSAGLLVLCCVGGAIATYVGAQKVAEDPEAFERSLRGVVADLAGPADVAAQVICTELMTEDLVDETWDRTSEGFRASTDRDGFDAMHAATRNVMGALHSMEIRTYNVRNQLGEGKFHDLVYDGTFENGEGTITLTLRDDGFLIETLRVDSPLFMQKLAEPTDASQSDKPQAGPSPSDPPQPDEESSEER